MSFRQALAKVIINGTDATDAFMPVLTDLTVNDKDGNTSDTAEFELADPDGMIALPEEGAEVEVHLGWLDSGVGLVFEGKVDDITCEFSKGDGHTMKISAKGLDTNSKAKSSKEKHSDKKKLKEAAEEFAKDTGLTVKVAKGLENVERDYWYMGNESFVHWGQRVAREIGATFKISKDKALFIDRNSGQTVSGEELPTIICNPGTNLLTCQISPITGRPRYQKVKARYYDRKSAKWKEKEVEVEDDKAKATHTARFTRADEKDAERVAGSRKKGSQREKGGGSLMILGNIDCKPEGKVRIVGVREGVDGEYTIESVTHSFSKDKGFTTKLSVKKPGGEAGKDSRSKSQKNAAKGGSGAAADGSSSPTAMTPNPMAGVPVNPLL
jgi:phage protein D